MLLSILLIILACLHIDTRRVPDEEQWNTKYRSDTNNGEFDRVISGYDFDTESFEEEIPHSICFFTNVFNDVWSLLDFTGYVFCTGHNKGIKQMCSPGTEVMEVLYQSIGCINKTTERRVYPKGSRCVSNPCENGGTCFDFSSANGYVCRCPSPFQGLHCHLLEKPGVDCGGRVDNMSSLYIRFTTDMALDSICQCINSSQAIPVIGYAAKSCHTDEVFYPKCEGNPHVGALPFTNKGFYMFPRDRYFYRVLSCPLFHIWNDTEKNCVRENN